MSRPTDILPERAGESDSEKRLREALNRMAGQMLQTVDAAIGFRTAGDRAQQARNLARNHLTDFALKAMHAHGLAETTTPDFRRTAVNS